MEKQTKRDLVAKLYNKIKFANQNKKLCDKYNEGFSKEHFHISAFYWFLKDNENLTDDEIREILNSNNRFSFLRKLDNLIPNLFEELKTYGIAYVENLYEQIKSGNKEINIKEERKSLLVDLYERIEQEKLLGSREKDIIVGGSYQRIRRTMSRPLTVTKQEMDQLVALSKFLRANPQITQEDLNELLNANKVKFGFLTKVNNMLPDLLLEIKDHGPQSVACYYANRIHVNEQIERRLP